MPDSMYLSVRDVRTVDDASLTVHLMLFYELQSIETMLDSTNDMIGDFINAASADECERRDTLHKSVCIVSVAHSTP